MTYRVTDEVIADLQRLHDQAGTHTTSLGRELVAKMHKHLPAILTELIRLRAVEKAATDLMREEQPHPCPDYALRAQYRERLRAALDAAKGGEG